MAERIGGFPVVNVYEIDEESFASYEVLKFDSPDAGWLDFVCSNRNGTYQGKQFDLVIGPVANDAVYRTVTLYLEGLLSKEEAIASFRIRKLFNQVIFGTPKAIEYLNFTCSMSKQNGGWCNG